MVEIPPCCFADPCAVCSKEEPPQVVRAAMCRFCHNDYDSDLSCSRCETSHERLKERGELPRRREAVMATREKLL